MNKKLRMQLSCPKAQLDFEVITLGNGSGSLLTNRSNYETYWSLLSIPVNKQVSR